MSLLMRTGDDGTIQFVDGISRTASGYVAIVNVIHSEFVPAVGPEADNSAIVYASQDGTDWRRVDTGTTFDHTQVLDLLSTPDGSLLAIAVYWDGSGGGLTDELRALRSADGITWTRESVIPPGSRVAQGQRGYVAVGSPANAARFELYFSPDASTWTKVYASPDDGSSIASLAAGEDGFVVSARRGSDSGSASYTLASADGRTWYTSGDLSVVDAHQLLYRITAVGPDWVAVGFASNGEMPVWWSANGLDWHRVGAIQSPGTSEYWGNPAHVVVADGHIFVSVAAMAEGSDSRPLDIFTSTDGQDWSMVDAEPETEFRVVALIDGVWFMGGRIGDHAGDAAIWRFGE